MSQRLRRFGLAMGSLSLPRLLWRLAAWVCAAVASGGCSIATWFPMPTGGSDYGVIAVPLTVKSFNCAPLGPIHPGDTLFFYAELEPATGRTASVSVSIPFIPFGIVLHDDGALPDAQANDDVFSGSASWPAAPAGQYQALLLASGNKHGEQASGAAQLPLEAAP